MKVYLAAFAGNLGMVSVGLFFGWASPSLPHLYAKDSPVPLTPEEGAWVASLFTFGAAWGSIISALVVNRIGRKATMLSVVVPTTVGWLMIAFARTPWELYVSRYISGIGTGIAYAATPMYLGEISPPGIRGVLSTMLTVAAKFGTVVEYAIGPFLSVRDLAFVSLLAPLLFALIFIWLPESPYHLMRRGQNKKALASLIQLRSTEDVSKELDEIERSVKIELASKTGFKEILFVPGNRRALVVSLALVLIQQLSGSQAIVAYSETIFNTAERTLEGKYLTIILGTVQVICTIICAIVVDRFGRKPLLLFSTSGAVISMAMVGTYFHIQKNGGAVSGLTWLPITGILMYVVSYSFGLAGLPFTMVSELFPTNVKALGSTIAIACCNVCAFLVTRLYQTMEVTFGVDVPFWVFMVCSVAGAIFTVIYIPETKGKTLQEIQEKLHRQKP